MRSKTSKQILTKKRPEKGLTLALKERAGRNFQGRITVRQRGSGAKRLYRIINLGQEKINVPGVVMTIEYDPNRTAFIALVKYGDGVKGYILAPEGIKIGDEIITAETAPLKPGNRIRLKNIPVGSEVFNIEIQPGSGGRLIRSAGTSAKVLAQEGGYTHLQMPSREVRKIHGECFATLGVVSFPEHRFIKMRKAGQTRLKGRRPHVRGSAMSPKDHPHGGGEGRTGIGFSGPKTPWGKPALGVKTRKRKHTDQFIIKRRKRKK